MTLGELLYDINAAYKKSCNDLEGYRHIHEVNDFLNRRKKDMDIFKELVNGYSVTANVLFVQSDLRKRGVESKFYGGICLKGADYFKVTKSIENKLFIQELSDEELRELQKQYYLCKEIEDENELLFDKDFAIFDELTQEEQAELMNE